MKPEGIIFMIISWGFIISLVSFSFYKIFKSGKTDAIGKRDLGM